MNKRFLVIFGVVALVLVLGGAAFIGGQMLMGQGLPTESSGGSSGMRIRTGAGPASTLDIRPAAELPQIPADARGVFERRQDNSIFVGTGHVTMMAQKDQAGNVTSSTSNNGATVEIVVTKQSQVYHDVTLEQFNGPPPSGQKLQQVLEPGTLDDIGRSSLITVWGKKTGDRIIADIIVYTSPSFSSN